MLKSVIDLVMYFNNITLHVTELLWSILLNCGRMIVKYFLKKITYVVFIDSLLSEESTVRCKISFERSLFLTGVK